MPRKCAVTSAGPGIALGIDAWLEGSLTMRWMEVPRVRIHDNAKRAAIGLATAIPGAMSVLVMALTLTGCAVGPKYVRPEVKVNNNWSAQHEAQVDTQTPYDITWWKAFGDPALDRLIDRAYHENLSLQIAGMRILEARARLGIAVGEQWPQFQAALADATGVGLSEHAGNSAGLNYNYWNYQVGFDASWELDFWHKYRYGVRADEAALFSTVAGYDNALVSLISEVARTYSVLRTFEVLIEQANRNITLQEEGLRIAESRFRNGATSELDVVQSATLLESTRTTVPQLEIGLQQSENALSTLLGQPTGTIRSLVDGPKVIPVAPVLTKVSVPAEMLRRRPDIRGAEFAAIAQCDRIGIAKADLYPRFVLFGSFGSQTSSGGGMQSGNSDFGDLFSSESFVYSFGPRVLWPLFNYGRIKNNVRVQDARFQQLLFAYQDTVIKAAQEVEDGLVGFLKSREATVFAAKAAEAAQRSVDLAFVQYREGAVDFQRVLDAQRSLLQEENTLANTQSSVATNWIALYKALGGGWEIREGQPFEKEDTRKLMEERTDWGKYFSDSTEPHRSTESTPDQR